MSWQPTDPRNRAQRKRRTAIIVIFALAATFVIPVLGLVFL